MGEGLELAEGLGDGAVDAKARNIATRKRAVKQGGKKQEKGGKTEKKRKRVNFDLGGKEPLKIMKQRTRVGKNNKKEMGKEYYT